MINPTSQWLHKHGLNTFGVSSAIGYYIYIVRGDEERWYEAAVDKAVYRRCKTDVQRRALVYKAIQEAMDEGKVAVDSDNDVDREAGE